MSLLIGFIIIGILIFIIARDDVLIPSDPYSLDRGVEYIIDDEVYKIQHPVRPNRVDKLGTDPLGRNVLSILITGTKVTIGMALIGTIIRLVIGIILSLSKKQAKKETNLFKIVLSLITNILIIYLILNIGFFKNLELNQAILAYGVVLGIVGGIRVSRSVSIYTIDSDVNDKKHLIKSMFPNIIISFFREMGISLFILCILGFLGITVGVNKFADIQTSFGVMPNYNPDWGGLLAISLRAIRNKAYWLVVGPLLFFILGISSFLLVSRGLSNNLEKGGSIVSSNMRMVWNFFSPRQYINDMRNFSWNVDRVIVKTLIVILIIVFVVPKADAKDIYQINSVRAWEDLEYITQVIEQYGDNSKEARDKIAEYISGELESIYRMYPVFKEGYIQNIEDNGKNVAGYIEGKRSNNPLVLVVDYGKNYYENGASVAAVLELARSLGEKHNDEMASRTIVFLFVDGTLEDGKGLLSAIGNENIERKSFYLDLNYLGLGNRLFIDTSTVFSGNERHYKNIRIVKGNAKDMKIPMKQEYFDSIFENTKIFGEKMIAGLPISGVNVKEHYKYQNIDEINIDKIDETKFSNQIQLIMNITTEYAWSDKLWLGDRY